MDGELVRLTGTEWAVLDCLWEASPQTMNQPAHTLAGREGWAKGTTTTVLKRMTEKGLLTCQQGERAKWYAPAVERRAAVVSETRSFLRRICRESVSMLTNAAAEPERLSREEIENKIATYTGGRAAEEVVMNTMTNGASQDIQDATNVARNMVAMFGMSDEFGMMALASRRNQYLDGGYGMDCAQDTAARMDQAVKDILDQCYQQAVEVIKASREDMDKVVAYLLEKETITGAEMVAIIEGRDPELVENPYASTRAEDKAFRPSSPETIEAPAKKVHMISQKIESPEEPAQEGQPENPVSDPSPSGGDAPQESGSTPSEPPKDTP